MQKPLRVLVIEDEQHLAQLLEDYLVAAGFGVELMSDGNGVCARLLRENFDLILLDLMLPGQDGMEVCRQVRAVSEIPIIMTTARVEESDRLSGFETGADDYICKPYSPREVVARVKAVLKRSARDRSAAMVLPELRVEQCLLQIGEREISLTATENRLLKLLMDEPGRIFSRQYIRENIYRDYRIVSERTIDSHIRKVRRKIADQCGGQEYIQSVYGMGYKYEPQTAAGTP